MARSPQQRLPSAAMKPSPLVILAHAPSAHALAADIASTLARLGYAVSTLPAAGLHRAKILAEADHVVLLWSRDAARAPGLRWAGKQAAKAKRLICLRTDAATPPPPLGGLSQALPKGRGAEAAWQALLAPPRAAKPQADKAAPAPAPMMERSPAKRAQASAATPPPASGQTSRLAGVGVLVLSAVALAVALYASDAPFAARINQLAGVAQAQAADIFKPREDRAD